MRSVWQRWIGWGILLLAAHACWSLDPQRALDHYGHQSWRTDAGLPQNTVHSILQTRDGFLWLGTDGGLVRFDGVEFVTFSRENTPALPSDTVYDLFEDGAGALWISTASGLLRYRGGGFQSFAGLAPGPVWFTWQDHEGRLWAMTAGGPAVMEQDAFVRIAGAQAANPTSRQAVAEDAQGTIWMGGSNGLLAIRGKSVAQHLMEGEQVETLLLDAGAVLAGTSQGLERYAGGSLSRLITGEVTALAAGAEGSLWVGTASGLVEIPRTGQAITLASEQVDRLVRDRQGVLWAATGHGLYRVREHQLQAFTGGSALDSGRILAVFEDREGNLWIGTDSAGLHMLRDQKFTTYTTRDGLSGDFIRCVYEDPGGALWVGTDGAGLNRRTATGWAHLSTADGLASNVILSLAGGPGGDLWIGTPDGLNLRHNDGRVEHWTTADGLPDDFVRSLLADGDGSLWIGTRHGLAHRVDGKFTTYSSMDGLSSDLIGAILRGNGELWVATAGGLSRRLPDHFARVSNDTVTAIQPSTNNTVWIGTNGSGLARLRSGELQTYSYRALGLPGTIYSILEDRSSHLWLCGQTGIFRVAIRPDGNPGSVTEYGTADGMDIRECSSGGHPSAWRTGDGSLWFATLDGVSVIDPAHIAENRTPPPVVIEQVLVDDQALPPGQDLVLPAGRHRLEVRYAGLSFAAPQKVAYRYRLQGLDRGWIEAGTRRAAFYTNLSPGRYRFTVLAANNDGVWSTADASLGIRQLPHFYQTWWFYSLMLLGLGATGYLAYRWRVQQVEAQFGAVLAERGRLAREIHDTLAQGFVGISVQLELLAQLLKSSREGAREQLDHQLDQTRALVRASLADARTSIWALRSETTEDLPARLRQSCDRVSSGSPARVYLQVKGTYRPVDRKIEDELLRIGQEAVSNAVRHADARRIDVQLVYATSGVSLVVADDGRGFAPSSNGAGPEGHYGIRGMRERAQEIDAVIVLDSAPGNGTRVSVEAPL
jgi:signal transduction histidine kinase/ligand-binding sensor domain-containing protein